MTGPEHYEHAEALLDLASDEDFGTEAERSRHAAARVHATLALAAATALCQDGGHDGSVRQWMKVAHDATEAQS